MSQDHKLCGHLKTVHMGEREKAPGEGNFFIHDRGGIRGMCDISINQILPFNGPIFSARRVLCNKGQVQWQLFGTVGVHPLTCGCVCSNCSVELFYRALPDAHRNV